MKETYIIAKGLIDGVHASVQENVGVLCENGRIVRIDSPAAAPANAEIYDHSGEYIMPALINAHVHLAFEVAGVPEGQKTDVDVMIAALKEMKEYLEHGVTHIRVCGASSFLDVKMRDAQARGLVKGPRIIAAGRGITMTGGSGHRFEIEADGETECRKAARFVIKNGADFIKIVSTGSMGTSGVVPGATQLTYEELKAAIDEAHHAGKHVGTHAHGGEGINNAVRAKVDSVEHGSYLWDSTIELMKEQGTYLVPTLTVMYYSDLARRNGHATAEELKKGAGIKEANKDSFQRAYRAGIKMVTGTDVAGADNRPSESWKELSLMVEYGASNFDAIQAATRNAAELLQISENFGTIEVGKVADIIAVSDNPLSNIDTVRDVKAVYQDGERVSFDGYII